MKVAIIGLGFMGVMHARIYQALPGVELGAVVDIDPAGAQKKLRSLNMDRPVYASLDDLLANLEVQVIDICSPTGQHVDLATQAAAAGKHVFIEKPLAFDLPGCEAIQSAVAKAGVHAQVGHCIRFWPEYVELRRVVQSDELGALKSLSLVRRAARPGGGNPLHWVNQAALSGGAALDLHVHDTDYVLHLLGTPKSVYSRTTQGMSGDDHIFTCYQYDTTVVVAEGGWDYPEHYGFCMAFEAIFAKGCLAYDINAAAPLRLTREGEPSVTVSVQQPGPPASGSKAGNISALGGYYNELQYFIACLQQNNAPQIATLAQASESIRVLRAELESAQTGQPCQLLPYPYLKPTEITL